MTTSDPTAARPQRSDAPAVLHARHVLEHTGPRTGSDGRTQNRDEAVSILAAPLLAREVLRLHEPDEPLHALVRRAIGDPGSFCARGGTVLIAGEVFDDPDWPLDWDGRPKYESITAWGARAALIAIRTGV